MALNPRTVLFPVIFQDHDGTWTWSIESGEAFEADHIVHARADGFMTKGDARKFMLEKMAELQEQGKASAATTAARAEKMAAESVPDKKGLKKKKTKGPVAADDDQAQPEWAVQAGGRIEAIFRDPALAQDFAREHFGGKGKVVRIRYGVLPGA